MARLFDVSLDELFGLDTTREKIDIEITEIIGVTRPELYKLSKPNLQVVFEKYLGYLEDLQKSKEWLLQKIRHQEKYIRELENKLENQKTTRG